MGVPALFRWLSKKYPKIIYPVVEEEEVKVPDAAGDLIPLPLDISRANPNNEEFDNLYLDMNGIVHPCTHPEGKPPPETEEEMMLEIFKYTERIMNMIRPRKLLFMAIDGVAPRAKMNQQRSRRFRSAQEAADKDEARKESVALWEAMGKTLSEEEKHKKSWDSNAITPGTPFMDKLAASLRYWVVQKLNQDPGWKDVHVIISDASVPGEGEHKIMDYIRRQRSNPGHNPNTRHVIYGLDADLIMLSLATHEPHFRVLREDVFQETKANHCRICGQEGHYAAQCTGAKPIATKTPEQKPFIFLDVAILREYLEVELNVPNASFPFNFEQAIDDWVFLIFFVGNDFLPHMPSLEIREGAIDTLLRIWKDELGRMGGYLTNHGQAVLSRVQIILDGLARREDDIFRRRRETEERQNQNAKRRRVELGKADADNDAAMSVAAPSPAIKLTSAPTAPPSIPPPHPSLPPRPDFAYKADSLGFGGPVTSDSSQNVPLATQALSGSNHDIVANRRAIRLANMSAAEVLKAELAGKPSSLPPKPVTSISSTSITASTTTQATPIRATGSIPALSITPEIVHATVDSADDGDEVPGLGGASAARAMSESAVNGSSVNESAVHHEADGDMDVDADADTDADADADAEPDDTMQTEDIQRGVKRSIDEVEDEGDQEETVIEDEDEEPADEDVPLQMKVNADGSVEQEDTVKLWEPGYKERYYEQKFNVPYSDNEFKKKITQCYVEGLCWVLHYYYQGTPSWQWYYPYHFAPFAADFEDIGKMPIQFDLGQPFKPFEQLMGVFPAASRTHIPEAFQDLMVNEDSPIIDFYPKTFQVDMNGKKMLWQGVALLPFIEEKRLLDAMAPRYPNISEDESRRNKWGNNAVYVSGDHRMYPFIEALYGKRKKQDPVPIDINLSKGINGSLLRDPECIPGSTYLSPLTEVGLPDIRNDRSISALYLFPKQLVPHRSVLLPGVRRPARQLTAQDLENARRGGRGRGRGGDFRGGDSRGGDFLGRRGGVRGPGEDRFDYGSSANAEWHRSSYRQPSHSYQPPRSSQPPSNSYSNYGYGGRSQASNGGYDPYGSSRGGLSARGGSQYSSSYGRGGYGSMTGGSTRGGYGGSGAGYGGGAGGYGGSGGGYGGYNSAGYGSYGGNAGYQGNGYGGGYGGGRGGNSYTNPSRGRGRARGY